jgi:coenzyme F420 hydrogenase subunit beta
LSENKALLGLKERVINKDLCTLCGACLSLCPYLRSFEGRVVNVSPCDLSQGRCFDYCPRTEIDLDIVYQSVFQNGYKDVEIGPFKRILMARSADLNLQEKAQSGGVVSALMDFALKEGIINAAVLTHRDTNQLPEGRIVHNYEEILACAGSSYVAGPTLEGLNKGRWKETDRIGMVGTPCQTLALAKMKSSDLERRPPIDQVKLVVGLFCTWAFTYNPFIAFLQERAGGSKIHKLDITPPPERLLKVTTDSATLEIPLDEVRPFIRPACGVCLDMTSELSDISVGTVEGIEGWNTVIVRTDRGEEVFDHAVAAGILETRTLPEEKMIHLREASVLKKQRALKALTEQEGLDKSYLGPSSELIQRLLVDIS